MSAFSSHAESEHACPAQFRDHFGGDQDIEKIDWPRPAAQLSLLHKDSFLWDLEYQAAEQSVANLDFGKLKSEREGEEAWSEKLPPTPKHIHREMQEVWDYLHKKPDHVIGADGQVKERGFHDKGKEAIQAQSKEKKQRRGSVLQNL